MRPDVRPVTVGVGGCRSGAGKTSVATLILKSFPGWGAIKYTKTDLYASIIDEVTVLSEQGKDTAKLLDAGAKKVLWVKSPYAELGDVLPVAVGMLSHLKGIVIEGNSAIEIIEPDIVIFVCGFEGSMKDSARKILRMADIVISPFQRPLGMPRDATFFDGITDANLMQCLSILIDKCCEKTD